MFNFSRPLDITIITKQIIEVTSSDSKFPPSPFRIYHDITLYRVVSNFFYTHDECTQQTFAIHKLPKPPFIIAFPLLADRSSPNWEGTNTIPRGTRNRCRRWGEGKKVGREGANRSTKPRFPGHDPEYVDRRGEKRERRGFHGWPWVSYPFLLLRLNSRGQRIKIKRRMEKAFPSDGQRGRFLVYSRQ